MNKAKPSPQYTNRLLTHHLQANTQISNKLSATRCSRSQVISISGTLVQLCYPCACLHTYTHAHTHAHTSTLIMQTYTRDTHTHIHTRTHIYCPQPVTTVAIVKTPLGIFHHYNIKDAICSAFLLVRDTLLWPRLEQGKADRKQLFRAPVCYLTTMVALESR